MASFRFARFSAAARGWASFCERSFFGSRAPYNKQLANVLYRRSLKLVADFVQITIALLAVVVVDTNLDQFVAGQADANFFQYRFGQSVLADRDNRIQRVGTGAQGTTLGSGDFEHRL